MITALSSTMREGEQTPGVAVDLHIKLAIADLLDEIGVDVMEAGHPVVSDEIRSAVDALGRRVLRATVAALARSLDRNVQLALERAAGFLGSSTAYRTIAWATRARACGRRSVR